MSKNAQIAYTATQLRSEQDNMLPVTIHTVYEPEWHKNLDLGNAGHASNAEGI